MTYGVVKSLHIISMVAWMAGMLYLPRLFVYHSQLAAGSEARATFETMERRLLRAIMLPAMLGTFIFGIWLATLLEVLEPRLAAREADAGGLARRDAWLPFERGEAPGAWWAASCSALLSDRQRGADPDPHSGGVPRRAEAVLRRVRRIGSLRFKSFSLCKGRKGAMCVRRDRSCDRNSHRPMEFGGPAPHWPKGS